jgi:hypothetical protein
MFTRLITIGLVVSLIMMLAGWLLDEAHALLASTRDLNCLGPRCGQG